MKANELSIIATGLSLDDRIRSAREQIALFTAQRMLPQLPENDKHLNPEGALRQWNATLQLLLILKEH